MRRRNQEPGSQFCRLTRTGLAATAIFVLLAFSSEAQAQTAATPAFTPTATTSTVEFYVTLTDSTSGATIYYTFTPTGTTPVTPTTSSSSVTSGGMVLISQSGTLEAMAVKSGYTNSAVASAAYVITGQVAAGWYHTVSLRTDGTVWTWGLNTNGANAG